MMRPSTSGSRARPSTSGGRGASRSTRPTSAAISREAAYVPRSPTPVPNKRPITRGLESVRVADENQSRSSSNVKGPREQTTHHQDASYFASMVRTKQGGIEEEMQRLEREIDRLDDEVQQNLREDEQRQILQDEVKQLEWELSDFQKAIEATRQGHSVETVMESVEALNASNTTMANKVDRLYLDKNKIEQEAKLIASDIDLFYSEAERRVEAESPEQLSEFRMLRSKLKSLIDECFTKQGLMQELNNEIKLKQSEAAEQHTKKEFKACQKRLKELEVELERLQVEEEVLNMNSEKVSAFQRQTLKSFQKTIAELDSHHQSYDAQIAELEDALRQLENDLALLDDLKQNDNRGGKPLKSSIHELKTQLQEILEQSENAEISIAQAGTSITRLEEDSGTIPSREEFEAMQRELVSRSMEVKVGQDTLDTLEAEHKQRALEWQRVQNMEETMGEEITSLTGSIENMTTDIAKFSDLSALHDKSSKIKEYLSSVLQSCRARKQTVGEQVEDLKTELETEKASLDSHAEWPRLCYLQKRIAQQEHSVHALTGDIATRTKQTDYQTDKAKCLEIADKLNAKLFGTV